MIWLGKLLTKDDIHVFTYDGAVLIDVDYIRYTIYDFTTGLQEVIRQTENSEPMRYDVGSYFVPLKLDPKVFRVGRHLVRWQIKKYFHTPLEQAMDEFDIARAAQYNGDFCKQQYAPSTEAGNVPNAIPAFNYTQSLTTGTCPSTTLNGNQELLQSS